MKRVTVSLPDDLVDQIKRAAGGEERVSAYVARALTDYQRNEQLDAVLAAWQRETPIPADVAAKAERELDDAGFPPVSEAAAHRRAG